MGGDDYEEMTYEEFQAAFKSKKGRSVFPRKLVEPVADFIYHTLEIKNIEEVIDFGSDGMESVINEVCENPPPPLVKSALQWLMSKDEPEASSSSTTTAKPKPMAAPKKGGKGIAFAFESEDEEDGGSVMGEPKVVMSSMEERDSARLRLSGAQITALYRSCFQGQIVTDDEVEGVPYGSDCTLTDWARKLKKTDIEPLPALLKKRDYGPVKDHFVALIREYNDNGMTQEVTIITTFITAAEEMFQGDDKALCAYIEAYMKLYKGRSFIKEVDLRLVVKSLRSTGVSQIRQEMKAMTEELKAAKKAVEAVDQLKAAVRTMQISVQTLEQKVKANKPGAPPGPGGGDEGGEGKKCGYCNETGHFFRNCPKRLADEEAKKAAAKAARSDE